MSVHTEFILPNSVLLVMLTFLMPLLRRNLLYGHGSKDLRDQAEKELQEQSRGHVCNCELSVF